MKAIILAAGYGTRLYPLTKDIPKALLPLGGKPIIEYIIERLGKLELTQIIIVTNAKHYDRFLQWLDDYIPPHPLKILNDGTKEESKRLGAIGDLLFAIDEAKIKEDIIVLVCDMIFTFSLRQFLFSLERKRDKNWIMLYDIGKKEQASSYGVAKVDELSRLTHYIEKPAEPFSSLVSIGIYYFPLNKFDLIRKFSREHNTDAPGYYIEWLIKNDELFAHLQRRGKWYDIGNKEQYQKVSKIMGRRK